MADEAPEPQSKKLGAYYKALLEEGIPPELAHSIVIDAACVLHRGQ